MNRKSGFTLVEIMIVVAIIGLLAAIAIPSFVKARADSQRKACVNNLRIMDASKEQAAMAQRWDATVTPMVDGSAGGTNVLEYVKGNTLPVCPGGGTYTFNAIGSVPTCSLSATPTLHTLP